MITILYSFFISVFVTFIVPLTFLIICSLIKKIYKILNPAKYSVMNIYSGDDITIFRKYIWENSEWEKQDHVSIGQYSLIPILFNWHTEVTGKTGIKHKFNDTKLKIEGYYSYEKIKVDNKIKTKTKYISVNPPYIKYVKIRILNTNIGQLSILNKMKELCEKNKSIEHRKLYTQSDILLYTSIYFEPYSCVKKNETSVPIAYLDEHFHKEKDRIFKLVTRFDSPEYERSCQRKKICILLHGPSGSGKTTLIQRLAADILHKIIEFSFRKLRTFRIFSQHIESVSKDKTIILIENIEDDIDYVLNSKGQLSLSTIEKFIKGDHTLSDKNSITFITTNDYNKFNTHFPTLIPCKHIIPIHIDYIDDIQIQNISEFYFDQKITEPIPKFPNIPTIEITNLALIHTKTPSGFHNFKTAVLSLIKSQYHHKISNMQSNRRSYITQSIR